MFALVPIIKTLIPIILLCLTQSIPCSGSSCDAPEYWYKIANFPGCPLTGTIDIPSDIPASEHSVFRWEWSAHHVVVNGQVEFYVACHDVNIESTAGPGRPDPLITIASPNPVGHLSNVASDYRDLSTPYSYRPGNMVGPSVASWTDCEVGTYACIAPDGFVPSSTTTTSTSDGTGATITTSSTTDTTSTTTRATSNPGNCAVNTAVCGPNNPCSSKL